MPLTAARLRPQKNGARAERESAVGEAAAVEAGAETKTMMIFVVISSVVFVIAELSSEFSAKAELESPGGETDGLRLGPRLEPSSWGSIDLELELGRFHLRLKLSYKNVSSDGHNATRCCLRSIQLRSPI